MKFPLPFALLLAALLLGPTLLGLAGCADPVVQYQRQLDYLMRVGAEAIEEGSFEEAREHFEHASRILPLASASDLEQISVLTQLTRACRELGRLEEAVGYADLASQTLARHRLEHGGLSGGVYDVGAAYLLERGRLEIARGDLIAAELVLADFVRVRGESGGDARESAEAQLVLGELRLVRGFDEEARALYRDALDQARDLEDRDPALRGFALYRVAERKIVRGRNETALEMVEDSRDGAAVPPLRPGLLLMRGRIDAAGGNVERAAVRLEEALGLFETGEPDYAREPAAPARAIVLASELYADPAQATSLELAVQRALEATRAIGSPLRGVLAGQSAVRVGRRAHDAGAVEVGIELMIAGRDAIDVALSGRVHDAGLAADAELAGVLAADGRLAAARPACDRLVAASDRLSDPARALHPGRLLRCGQIAAARRDAHSARAALGRGLMILEEAGGEPVLQMEMLLRLAALAHDEGRDAEEGKLFDRILPFVLPGVYEALERLIVDAYSPYGRFQPSSAAARLGHAAARTHAYTVEAPQLQALAEKLAETPSPAAPR